MLSISKHWHTVSSRLALVTWYTVSSRLGLVTFYAVSSRLGLVTWYTVSSRLGPVTCYSVSSRLCLVTCYTVSSRLGLVTWYTVSSRLGPVTYHTDPCFLVERGKYFVFTQNKKHTRIYLVCSHRVLFFSKEGSNSCNSLFANAYYNLLEPEKLLDNNLVMLRVGLYSNAGKIKRFSLERLARSSNNYYTDKLVALGTHLLSQYSVLQVFQATASRIRRKSKQSWSHRGSSQDFQLRRPRTNQLSYVSGVFKAKASRIRIKSK